MNQLITELISSAIKLNRFCFGKFSESLFCMEHLWAYCINHSFGSFCKDDI